MDVKVLLKKNIYFNNNTLVDTFNDSMLLIIVSNQSACSPVLACVTWRCAVSVVIMFSDYSEGSVSRRFRNRSAVPHFPDPRHSR